MRSLSKKLGIPRKWLAIISFLVVAIGVFVILELSDTINMFGQPEAESGVITSANESDTTEPSEKTSTTSSQEPTKSDPSPSPPTGSAPVTPYGNFVSNHNPNLDGNPAPSAIQSVCNTTPGAKCSIEFTNQDGVVKSLPAQTTDNNGATIWNWDVKQAGFTEGSWKVKVIATLNSQTATTGDALNLEVEP